MHEEFLKLAIELSREKMLENQGGPFAAVIVRKGEVIGRGWNQVTSRMDPTAHAEMMAIRDACRELESFSLAECSIYSSCEPCPMCLGGIYWARLEKIFFAASCSDASAAGFDDGNFYSEFSKQPQQRTIPAQQFLRKDAQEVFRLWSEKSDRTEY